MQHKAKQPKSGGERKHGDAVKAINVALQNQDTSNLKIGEIVDGVIGPAGRADYGAQVIARLAADPNLQCSAEHLRRCWHYYRLMLDHGAGLRDQFPGLKYGHYCQISRLLQLETEFSAAEVTNAVQAIAQKAVTDGKGGKPMSVDALGKAVATHLKSLKGRGLKPEEQDDNGNAEAEDPVEIAHVALSDSIGAIREAAELIASSDRYDHACRLQTDVDRIADAHLALLGHIVRHDPQSIVIPAARKRIIALAGLVGLKVVEVGDTKQKEVAP
jgi:hypothetical protein